MHIRDKDRLNLLSIIEAINKILDYTDSINSPEDLARNIESYHASMMNFIVIGEMSERLSDSFVQEHSEIEWYKIRGFRNRIAHDYFGLDTDEIWEIIKRSLPKLKNQINSILD